MTKVMPGVTTKDLLAMLKKAVKYCTAKLMTDEFRAYKELGKVITHKTVNHGRKEYARGEVHTNTVEGFFSIIKSGIRGNYRVISKKYLPFYLAEYCYKYNRRNLHTADSFNETIENTVVDDKCFTDYKPNTDVKKIAAAGSQRTQNELKQQAKAAAI